MSRPLLTSAPLDHYKGIERFEAAQSLMDAWLFQQLEQTEGASSSEVLNEYLEVLYREYQMAKSDLAKENATRDEVVALGLAMKEMAFSYDKEIAAFSAKQDKSFHAFRKLTGDLEGVKEEFLSHVAAYESELNQQRQSLEKVRKEYECAFQKEISSYRKGFQQWMRDHGRRATQAHDEFQQVMGDWKKTEREARDSLEKVRKEYERAFQKEISSYRKDFQKWIRYHGQRATQAHDEFQRILSEWQKTEQKTRNSLHAQIQDKEKKFQEAMTRRELSFEEQLSGQREQFDQWIGQQREQIDQAVQNNSSALQRSLEGDLDTLRNEFEQVKARDEEIAELQKKLLGATGVAVLGSVLGLIALVMAFVM